MAVAAVSMRSLKDILECPICNELYTDPRTLPCVHTFCCQCIAEWSNRQSPANKVSCPVCREEFTVPDNGIQQLPKNLLAANFLTVRQLSGTSAEFELCEVCSQDEEAAVRDRTVKMFCVDCQQSMCKLCSQSHSKMRASSHHRLVGKEKQLTGVYSQYHRASCDKHRDKFLEIYCFDCKSVMCTMCCVTQHNAHKCADFSEVADSFRAEMVEVAETINSAIKSLEDKLMTLESAKKCYVNNIQTVEAEICKKAEELKAIIDRHKNQLLDEVAEVKSQRVKEIDDLSCEIVKDKSLLETFEIYCEELLTKGSHSDIIREAEMLHVKASEMLMVDSLQHSLPTLDTADIKFRSSDILLEDANRSNMVGETFKDSALKGPETKPSMPICVHCLDDFPFMVTAMALYDNELFVKRSGIAELLVYDKLTLKMRRRLTVADLGERSVFGMATCATNRCLFISDNMNSVVHKVNLSAASNAPNSMKWSVMRGPTGLSVNSACNVLVASQDSKKIQEFTPVGSLVREILDSNGLWHAVELSNGNLVVSRLSPANDICLMTKQGQVIRSYTDTSKGPSPRWMIVDNDGFIVVADCDNNQLLVVNPSLTETRKLQLRLMSVPHPMTKPFAVCWDLSCGRIFVGENRLGHDNRVLVFDGVCDVVSMFVTEGRKA